VHIIDVLLFFSKGHATSFGLIDDLRLSKLGYKWTVTIFFIPYVSNKSERGNHSSEGNLHELKRCDIVLNH
jgi:hypothetical protein